jgi:cbb3-type cytochrome oxidase subunit 1
MRATGGVFILTGGLLMAYNAYRTITTPVESFRLAGRRELGAVAAGE